METEAENNRPVIWVKIHSFFADLKEKQIFTYTAAVAFFAFLSIFPFLLLVLSLAGRFVRATDALAHLRKIMEPFPPELSSAIINLLSGMMDQSDVLTAISLFFLLLTAYQMFIQLQNALHHIMGIASDREKHRHHFWLKHLNTLVFFMAFFLLFFLLLVLGGVILRVLAKFDVIPFLRSMVVIEIAYIGFEILFFSFSYWVLAVHRLSWRSVWIAGTVVAVCWEVMKFLFSWYIGSMKIYSALYGSIGSLFLFQLWLLYSIFFYLLGAALAMAWEKRGTINSNIQEPSP